MAWFVTALYSLKLWATGLADKVIPASSFLQSPRAQAFSTSGLAAFLSVYPGHRPARLLMETFAVRLLELLRANRREGWTWFEPVLAYDNARLPEALLRAGLTLSRQDMADEALEALDWLARRQTATEGHFRPIGTQSFGLPYDTSQAFDQQPLEAWATIDACAAAFQASGDAKWLTHVETAYAWYLGANDLGLRLALPDGGCFDGLQIDRVNLNQGAESILAWQFAALAMRRLQKQTGTLGGSSEREERGSLAACR